MAEALLALEDLRAGYGEAVVLDGISLTVPEHGSLAVLGRNGVGKTTLIMPSWAARRPCAAPSGGAAPTSRGSLPIDVRSWASAGWRRSARSSPRSPWRRTSPSPPVRDGGTSPRVYKLFPRLKERRSNMGNQLSGGEQQMLATARALMTNPSLLLLDEPLEGLAPIIVEELAAAIKTMIAEEGVAVILIEQHADLVLSLTHDAVIMERGTIVHRAKSADLLRDQATLDRYIGLRVGEAA